MATAGSSLTKMSKETFDFICTSCDRENKTVEAVRYCVECSGYCCQACTDTHRKFPTIENHNLMDVNQWNQAGNQRLPEFPTERCGEHHDRVLDLYCENHDIVGCYICLSKDHRSCPDSQIFSISDMVDKLFNLSVCKQTQQHLTEIMTSMTALCDSKDVQLAKLVEIKNEGLRKVNEFQKALLAAIKRAAEMSKKELEDMYKKLEESILQDKAEVKKTEAGLRSTRDKIKKAGGNRAQSVVLTKLAEQQLKEADDQMSKLKILIDPQLSFTPSLSLMDYINGQLGIGEVTGPIEDRTDQAVKKYGAYGKGDGVRPLNERTDLYKVKESRDIDIKDYADSFECRSFGCCLTLDNNQLLFTDYNEHKLKLLDTKNMEIIDFCRLDGRPLAVCCVRTHEAAVTCEYPDMIQFVSIDKTITPTRQIKLSHKCYGIAIKDDKLYITESGPSLYIYDRVGNLLKTISQDNDGNKLFYESGHIAFNNNGKMYVCGGNDSIVCLDDAGNYLSIYNDNDLKYTDGICTDGRGGLFVVGNCSHNVIQFNEDGKKIGVVIKQQDGLEYPRSVCFNQKLNRLFVSLDGSDVLKMYELE